MKKASALKEPKERFSFSPTSLPKVYLKGKAGVWPKIPSDIVDLLYWRTKEYAKHYFQIKGLRKKLPPLKKEIVRIAKENKKVYGIGSEKDNFDLTVIQRRIITWDRNLLKKSLRIAYPGVVTDKELLIKISIPDGFKPEILKTVVCEALIRLGIPEKDLLKIMDSEIVIDVDEKRLNELMKGHRGFKLRPGAKKEEIVWIITVEPFKKTG